MYSKLPNLVLGFHGCDISVFDEVIKNKGVLNPSENSYDWLGHGIYFWENNPQRALEWALNLKQRKKVKKEAVIGAVIDLGYCLNLLESESLQLVKEGYHILCKTYENYNRPLPQNERIGNSLDLLLRHLDCAVIETIHEFNATVNEKPYEECLAI